MAVRVGKAKYGGSFTIESEGDLPFVLPGELVDPSPFTILEPSPNRISPACIHFGVCGGCHYQHIAYPTQLQLKSQILQDLLPSSSRRTPPFSSRSEAEGPAVAFQIHSADPLQYRNRIRLRAEQVEGTIRLGYSRRNTNDFLPVQMCPIAGPLVWRAAETLLRLGKSDPLCARWLTRLSEIELFSSPDEIHLQIQFFLRDAEGADQKSQDFTAFTDRLKSAIPEVVVASAQMDPELSRRTRRSWPGATRGAGGFSYNVAARNYWVPRGAFFQVNRFLVDQLVSLVTANRSGTLAWDLFAGVGLFSRPLAESFDRVVAVEGAEASASALAKLKSVQAVHSPTLDFLRAAILQRERPTLVVLDPPRAGLGPEGSALLARIAPAEIVYVSCDPVTLARDLAILLPTYRAEAIHLVDLFPQTFHIETVVFLRKI